MKVKKIEVNKINTFIEEHPRTLTWNRILAHKGALTTRNGRTNLEKNIKGNLFTNENYPKNLYPSV